MTLDQIIELARKRLETETEGFTTKSDSHTALALIIYLAERIQELEKKIPKSEYYHLD